MINNDSHLINGTLEGDYAERKSNNWIVRANDEGRYYEIFDSIKITQ